MRIDIKGRNFPVTDEMREQIERRFQKVGKQVSPLAVLEVELSEERNPANPENQVAEATLHLKGTTLRAKDASRDMGHAVNLMADEMARQVKRHREKRRARRASRAAAEAPTVPTPLPDVPRADLPAV